MLRQQFRELCAKRLITVADAGRDWADAGVKGRYLVGVLYGVEDYEAIKHLVASGQAYLTFADQKAGQGWFEHFGNFTVHAKDATDLAKQLAKSMQDFFANKDTNYQHYSSDDIALRDKMLAEYPALDCETQAEHFQRVAELSDNGWLAPIYVSEPGIWDRGAERVYFTDADLESGIWHYEYDSTSTHILVILDNDYSNHVKLIQQPYRDTAGYVAAGYLCSETPDDETGPTVTVTWAIIEGNEALDDESSACDWGSPLSVNHYRYGDITDRVDVDVL